LLSGLNRLFFVAKVWFLDQPHNFIDKATYDSGKLLCMGSILSPVGSCVAPPCMGLTVNSETAQSFGVPGRERPFTATTSISSMNISVSSRTLRFTTGKQETTDLKENLSSITALPRDTMDRAESLLMTLEPIQLFYLI
jgi:hypothetical protein